MVNELQKSIQKEAILNNFLSYMLKEKNEIHKTMTMIWINKNMTHSRPFRSP